MLSDDQRFRGLVGQDFRTVIRHYDCVGDEVVDHTGVGEPGMGVEYHAGFQFPVGTGNKLVTIEPPVQLGGKPMPIM